MTNKSARRAFVALAVMGLVGVDRRAEAAVEEWCLLTPAAVQCGSPGTYCAASCNEADVEAAFDELVAGGGGVLFIPAGHCTWTSNVGLQSQTSLEFYILGAGTQETVVDIDGTYGFSFSPAERSGFRGLAYSTWNRVNTNPGAGSRLLAARTNDGAELCVHHLKTSGWGHEGRIEGYNGVVHSCEFGPPSLNNTTAPNNQNSYGFYVMGDGGWNGYSSSIPPFGTRANLFFEDNLWREYGHQLAGFCSSRFVFRKNSVLEADAAFDTHEPGFTSCWPKSTDPSYEHAGRAYEVYDNQFFRSTNGASAINPRSGAGMIFNNHIENYHFGVQLELGTNSKGPLCTVAQDCVKTYDFDNNNCSDPEDGCCEAPDQVWVWNNDCVNVDIPFQIEGGHPCLREGREYYLRAPSAELDNLTYAPYVYPHPLRAPLQTCSALAGSCCPLGSSCVGGTFEPSTDCGGLCCLAGVCAVQSDAAPPADAASLQDSSGADDRKTSDLGSGDRVDFNDAPNDSPGLASGVPEDSGGCSCRAPGTQAKGPGALWLLLLLANLWARSRLLRFAERQSSTCIPSSTTRSGGIPK